MQFYILQCKMRRDGAGRHTSLLKLSYRSWVTLLSPAITLPSGCAS